MSNPWYSYFVLSDDFSDAARRLDSIYRAQGWTTYDPFPGGSGTPFSLKVFAKHFILPAAHGSVRVICETPMSPAVLAEFSRPPLLRGWLEKAGGGWEVIRAGNPDTSPNGPPRAFGPFTTPGRPLEDITRALSGLVPVPAVGGAATLPPEVEKLAQQRNVNPKQADKLAERMSGGLFGRFGAGGGAAKDNAQAFLSAGIDWNSEPGRRIRAAALALILPDDWREPDYVGAKDAYQASRALARNPKAMLTNSEQTALRAFPIMEKAKPLFFGRP